jgi:hypothetical protein
MGNTHVASLLTVTPRHRFGDPLTTGPLTSAKGYAFYADTAAWDVASYEDAVAGMITAKEGGQTRPADMEGSEAKYDMRIGFEFRQAPEQDTITVVVYDTELPMYAITQIVPSAKDWPATMQEEVMFVPATENETVTSGAWEMYYGDTVPGEPIEENYELRITNEK